MWGRPCKEPMFVSEELTTGSPPALLGRVAAVPVIENLGFESGFRGSGLRPGDRIVAVDGVPLTRPPDGAAQGVLVGQYLEHMQWQKASAKRTIACA